MAGRTTEKKTIALALQGGGAHGAFTWGVLDRLLEDDRVIIEGMSGTSSGAMNAVVVADGLEKGDVKGAREALTQFWEAMGMAGAFNLYRLAPLSRFGLTWSPFEWWLDWFGQTVSPYQFNPSNINPLKNVLAEMIDLEVAPQFRTVR